MEIIRSAKELRSLIDKNHANGDIIGFVPTMGALHGGHLGLIDVARQNADKVVVSIFVNPAQFAPHEDFDKYPRPIEDDLQKLRQEGVDIVYLPTKDEIYPQGFDIKISVGAIGQDLEGITRPHFFDGIVLVVTKLFMQVRPDIAVFGEKDFQQLHIINKLVSGLDIGVKIIAAATMREDSGLAMASRNVYLSESQNATAANLYKTLHQIRDKIINKESIENSILWGKDNLIKAGFDKVDYLELRDAQTLEKTNKTVEPSRLLAAVYLGNIRLIDNIEI